MSKRALNKDLFREIRKTRSRFFSILMLVVIAVCFLFGLRMTAPDMKASMDAYLDRQQLMDVHVMSTLGLTQEDVDVLAQTEGTQAAEGFYTVDALASGGSGQDTLVVKAISLGESGINAPCVTQGRLPQSADECLAEESLLLTLGLELGDEITLDTGTGSYEDALVGDTFTIVGVGQSPLYVSLSRGNSTLGNGSVSAIVTLDRSAYAMDYFTDLYIRVEGAEALNAYEDAYEDLIADYTDCVEVIRSEREEARTQQVIEDAQAEIDDAWEEYYDAKDEADQELADAWQELTDARTELDDGWADYDQGKTDLADARQEISDGRVELADARDTLNQGEEDYSSGLKEYQNGKKAYDDGVAQYQKGDEQYQAALQAYESGYQQYQAALSEYQAGEAAYADGAAQLEAGETAYADGLAQYEAGEAEYADGLARYETGEAAYADGLAQYEAGEAAYTDGLAQYEEGEAEYADGLAAYEEGLAQYEAGAQALEEQRQKLLEAGFDEKIVDALLAEKQQELDSAKAELDEAEATLEASRAKLDETKETLESSRSQLDETKGALESSRSQLDETKGTLEAGRAQLDETKEMLEFSRKQLDENKEVLESTRTQLDEAKAILEATEEELVAGKTQLDENGALLANTKSMLESSKSKLEDAKKQVEDARSQLDEGWKDYYSGLAELEDAEQEVRDGEQELLDAYEELTDGEQEYADGLVEYNDGKAEAEQELADARQEIEDGQREVDDIEPAEWYILDRTANTGFASYQQDAQRMTKLATVFPTVFFLVAALVCLTAMTRMVEEQRVEIGGLKALGYSKLDIARKYVGYGLLASVIGGVIGLVLGGIGIPWVIVTCWKVMYDYPGVSLTFSWPTALACMLAAMACCTLAVLVAALAALRATPAALMRPRAPQPGKRVWLEHLPFVWKRMSFSQKVTARNLFRYKKRFWMTVIGIAGCTGLMVTGFGLRDSIMDVVDLQFTEISPYSAVLYTDDDMTDVEESALLETLEGEEELTAYTPCYLTTVTLESDSYSLDGNLLAVEEPEDLDGFWNFRDRLTGEPVEMQETGALISEKTAELLGLSVGDTITVVEDNRRGEIPITGIVENYVRHYVYLTKAAYAQAFGEKPEDSQILLSYPETADWGEMGSRLLGQDCVTGIYYLKESQDMIRNQLNGVYPAVIIIITAAAALAFVVLYNLSSINITERLRELATLKVLGFRDGEMRQYVFRENLVLTLIGMALGILLGKWFHAYLITTVEVELVMFGREAHPLSYILALALTIFFALLVNLAAGRKLRKIDMVESLKTVE
ncbi:MAG: FtsX-like permease family protein [Candidatus Onthomonas sp.]